tara:strand:- start:8764 stop:9042 length:279 start_codon:yes stop_codon:yes gene_type:complete
MTVKVKMAAVIQKLTDNQKEFTADGNDIYNLILNIEKKYPGFQSQILTDTEEVHQFLNIYVNDEDIRFLAGLKTTIGEGDIVSFLPALAGGQ